MNARQTTPVRAKWWRFSAYEVKDGYLRPAPDARLEEPKEYDIGKEQQRRRKPKKKEDPLYAEAIGLLPVGDLHVPPPGET